MEIAGVHPELSQHALPSALDRGGNGCGHVGVKPGNDGQLRIHAADRVLGLGVPSDYHRQALHLAWRVVCALHQLVRLASEQPGEQCDGPFPGALTIHRAIPDADLAIIEHLVEFCLHWLAAGRVGAVLTWSLNADPRHIGHAGYGAAVDIPARDITRREHFSPLLNALAQYDRAAVVDSIGVIGIVGVTLQQSPEAILAVAPFRGTRHTSAKRFSYAEPQTVSFVVSARGPISVFYRGEQIDLGSTTAS